MLFKTNIGIFRSYFILKKYLRHAKFSNWQYSILILHYLHFSLDNVLKDLMEQRRKASKEQAEECRANKPESKGPEVETIHPEKFKVSISEDEQEKVATGEKSMADELSEEEITNLVNKYLERMGGDKIPTNEMSNKEDVTETKEESPGLLSVTSGPAGSKQLRININKLMTSSSDLHISQVFSEFIGLLQAHTNFDQLSNQEQYSQAIGKLVEAALSDGMKEFDKKISDEIDKLTTELKPKTSSDEKHNVDMDPNVWVDEAGKGGNHYIREQDLEQPVVPEATVKATDTQPEVEDSTTDQSTSSANINYKHASDNLAAQQKITEQENGRTSVPEDSLELISENVNKDKSDVDEVQLQSSEDEQQKSEDGTNVSHESGDVPHSNDEL